MAYIEYIPKCDDTDECGFEREEEVGAIARRHEEPLDG